MSRIRKGKPNLHVVVLDTNVLWHKDKAHPVNPEFDAFWTSYAAILDIELIIPYVVYGELQFQQVTCAQRALDKANEAFEEISAVTSHSYSHKITSPKIRANVRQKIDKWILEKKAKIKEVPCSEIEWQTLIEKAIWREPPFNHDQKEKVSEKGFRDALIMETLSYQCKHENRDATTVFISADSMLRTTAQKELKDDKRCLFFESITDFASYIKLTQEKLTNHFISLIMSRATEKFYKPKDETCLYSREKIPDRILSESKEVIEHPEKAETSAATPWENLASTGWQKTSRTSILIGNSQFVNLEGKNTYHWMNPLHLARLYKREQVGQTLLTSLTSTEHLLVLGFVVKWKTNVKADGRFHDLTLEGIEKVVSTFTEPTDEQKKQYGLFNIET